MTKQEALADAVAKVKETGFSVNVLRRGDQYRVVMNAWGSVRGWRCAEMIGPGNVHSFEAA